MKKFFVVVTILSVVAAAVGVWRIGRLREENRRLESNCRTLMNSVELYRTRAGESAAAVERLTLRCEEFRRTHGEDLARIRDLGLRLRRVESMAVGAMQSRYDLRIGLRDTVVVRDTLRDTVRIFSGGDAWSRVEGRIDGDTVEYSLRTVDTIRQIVHRVPRKFLFIRYGTKAIRQEMISSNPHTQLVYTAYIELAR